MIRVLRLLEYQYADVARMQDDMTRWQVQGTYRPHSGLLIRSTTLPLEVLDDPVENADVDLP